MNSVEYIYTIVLPAAFKLLPAKMDTPPARALVMTIGLQESRFMYRRQVGGPARGFWQFEKNGGVEGVLTHPASRRQIQSVLLSMHYEYIDAIRSEAASYEALANNDILACVFARLLLWTSAEPLPGRLETEAAWRYYLDCWRPGKPHQDTWANFHSRAWQIVDPH